eukprot:SAG31_NODE_2316_length_5951_cov_7.632262_1_plen_23_part_10
MYPKLTIYKKLHPTLMTPVLPRS